MDPSFPSDNFDLYSKDEGRNNLALVLGLKVDQYLGFSGRLVS